jgi:GNAT superfamily N-acetyltransferase
MFLLRKLSKSEFKSATQLLDSELKKRVRSNQFLFDKFKKFPQFFIGIFLEKQLIGVICGFPREDYLLISELAIDPRFQKRGFASKLVKAFEAAAKTKYHKINVGALNEAIGFYSSLNYKPFLLAQYNKKDYSVKDFNFKILQKGKAGNMDWIAIKKDVPDVKYLEKMSKRYPKAYFQYIFTKKI